MSIEIYRGDTSDIAFRFDKKGSPWDLGFVDRSRAEFLVEIQLLREAVKTLDDRVTTLENA